jgi:hypothetical protein
VHRYGGGIKESNQFHLRKKGIEFSGSSFLSSSGDTVVTVLIRCGSSKKPREHGRSSPNPEGEVVELLGIVPVLCTHTAWV